MDRNKEYKSLMLELENTPIEMSEMSPKTKIRAKKRAIKRRTAITTTTFVMLLAVMVAVINFSPIVAHAFGQIPVLRQIAAAVNFSPSLSKAVEHEFIQHIGQEQTIGNVTMRIEYVIVDQRQLNIFYSLNSPVYSYIGCSADIFCAEDGLRASVVIMGGGLTVSTGDIRQTVVVFSDDTMPDQLIFELRVHRLDALYMTMPVQAGTYEHTEPEIIATFNFLLEFDPGFTEQGETIYVNREFVIDGQVLTITTVEIYPTHMRANFTAHPDNTAWLRSLRFYAENEHGDRFYAIDNGITAFGGYGTPMMVSHHLNSPFFSQSNQLTLHIEEVVWLDKDMQRVRIDLANSTADRLPEGVTLDEVFWNGDSWHLTFAVEKRSENHSHSVFGTKYYNEIGDEFFLSGWSSGVTADESKVFFLQFKLDNFPYNVVYLMPDYSRVVSYSIRLDVAPIP